MGRAPLASEFVFTPRGRATVEVDGDVVGRSLVRVTARDQIGLLWAICRWFADRDVSIESVHAATEQGVASDTLVVDGDCDADELAAHLSRPGPRPKPRGIVPRPGWCRAVRR